MKKVSVKLISAAFGLALVSVVASCGTAPATHPSPSSRHVEWSNG